MAGDWIKMRGSLGSHPRVMRIASILESSPTAGKQLTTGFNGCLNEVVTRDVTRDVTLASLLRVWCAANEHTSDGVWQGLRPADLDHIAGVPGFGAAMEAVGWAVYDPEADTTTMPGFLEHNAPAKGGRDSAAARQKRYRERKKGDGNSDVTRDVTQTVTRDVEKRREEKITNTPIVPARFEDFWKTYPSSRRVGKGKCMQLWLAKGLTPLADQILLHVEAMKGSAQWKREEGRYIPTTVTYLNQRRYDDGTPESPAVRLAV